MRKINSIIKKLALACLMLFAGSTVFAQGQIDLNPNTRGTKISESSFVGFNSTFSFDKIEGVNVETEKGEFSAITMGKTVNAAEIGAPSLPVARELVAVPFGATPVVKVVSYSTQDYKLSDFGINKIYPQQPSYSKAAKAEDMVFQYNEKAYQTRTLENAPKVDFEVLGTMRGVQLGALQIEPISYNPASNTIRVFNDIELEVVFENADVALTEKTLLDSYSPYFDVIYKQLFNSRAINDVYDDHPDLFAVPVKMLVIANRMFEETLAPWIEWKTQKGFFMNVKYTDEIGTTSNDIKSYIQEQYATNKPSFLVIVGDKAQVAPSINSAAETACVSDLYYSSVDGDIFPDIYHSRMSCETVDQLEALLEKVLQYEKYTMPDPSYLQNVLLIAGHDDYGWTPKVGRPSIQYATNYYYNEEHGYEGVHAYLGPDYSGCYTHLSDGVGFANYTAHGGKTSWSDPSFTVSNVYGLTNTDKYFWAMGNCCIAADWGYGSECFGEAMIRAEKKGAWGYIGSCPNTYWWEDYYFAVGATTVHSRMPLYEETTMGNYDALWMEDSYNVLASVPFVGNLAVVYAHAMNYSGSVSNQYYFEAYHTLGDGSVMPYRSMPSSNDVSHLPALPIGENKYTVAATPGSYVGISKDGVLHGAGMIDESGSTEIQLEPIMTGGDVTIVVTHPKHIPYIQTVPAAALEGAYLTVGSFTPNQMPANKDINFSVVVQNVGTDATSSTATMTISCEEDYVTITDATATISALAADAEVTLENEFGLKITEPLADGTRFKLNYVITDGEESWEGYMNIIVVAPVISFDEFVWAGAYQPGETYTVAAKFANTGSYKAENVKVTASTTSSYLTIEESEYTLGTIEADGVGVAIFTVTVSESSQVSETHQIDFALTADNDVTAEGVGIIRNSCMVQFILNDSYGDGWDASTLTLKFDDGSQDMTLDLPDGSSATHNVEIGTGIKVEVYFNANGYWDYECSYTIQYEDGTLIYDSNGEPNSGFNVEFEVNCAGAGGESIEFNPARNLQAEVNMNQVTLTWDAPRAFVNYMVMRDGIQIAETEETTYVDSEVVNGTHTYNVIAVYEEGQSLPVSVVVTVGGDSIDENNIMFSVYPNPAQDVININSNAAEYEYQLINALGQVVVSGQSTGKHQINVSNINRGVYFLKIVANGETAINKISVQ